ncbi:MAG: hypothetical protein PHO15_02560 [Eubacteriales bacterium]|nr:hypothetical protein [Eubacteriales bacterium]
MEGTADKPLISCKLTYRKNGESHDNADAVLTADTLTLSAPGFHQNIRLCTLSGVSASGYMVFLQADDGVIELSMIGHLYEDFSRHFICAFNEIVFIESLMNEKVHFEADGQYIAPGQSAVHAVFRICETALSILPDTHALVRIPFCMIGKTQISPYCFEVTDKLSRTYALQKMGRLTDAFLKAYETRVQDLKRQAMKKLGDIAPADERLAKLLMDGAVARISDISAVSGVFSNALEEKLAAASAEYVYLKEVADDMAIGIKRGLMGDLTGESIIILAPVFNKNIMAMESLGDTATATYLFRITDGEIATPLQWIGFLPVFNYSMLSVNFRREPIYLSDDALREEKYAVYSRALKRINELAQLRSLYKGRVSHSGFDNWKKAVESYIR